MSTEQEKNSPTQASTLIETANQESRKAERDPIGTRWTFLSNHTHVLLVLFRNPSIVLREVAMQVGITERAVQRIVADLEEEGFLEREKIGRQNHYRVIPDRHLRHPIEQHCTIGNLLKLICETNREVVDLA